MYDDIKHNRNSMENAVKSLKNVEMDSAPGSKGQYCNTCYNTLGLIIESVSGQPYASYMNGNFFSPLGMRHTTFHPQQEDDGNVAREYGFMFGFSVETAPYWKEFGESQMPEGGAYSNVTDLALFASAALGFGPSTAPYGEWINKYAQVGIPAADLEGVRYTATGFEEQYLHGKQVLYKTGDGMGSASEIILIPEVETAVVLLIGESNSERRSVIGEGLVDLLLDQEPKTIENVPNYMRVLGYISLGLVLFGVLILVSGIFHLARLRKRNYRVKRRWAGYVSLAMLAVFSVPFWYLLLFVRPSEAGFYGYPYDTAIGLIVTVSALTSAALYTGWMLIFTRNRR